jgi:cell wall-associated NlpC family hydrolase
MRRVIPARSIILAGRIDDSSQLQRGDLVFWHGHVGIMQDGKTLIHANAHHMAVASEPLDDAIARIAIIAGPVTALRRPNA